MKLLLCVCVFSSLGIYPASTLGSFPLCLPVPRAGFIVSIRTGREKVSELLSDIAVDCCYSHNSLSLIVSIYDQFMMMAQVSGSGLGCTANFSSSHLLCVVFKSLYMTMDFCVQDSLLHCIVHQEIFSIHIFVSTFSHSVNFFT